MNVLSVLDDSGDSSSLWLVVGLQEALTDDKSILFLLDVRFLSDPDINVLLELQDESVVGIQVLSLQGSLGHLGAEQLPCFV